MFLLCMFPGLTVWCLFPEKTVSPTSHSQSRVEAFLWYIPILIQCLKSAPRSLNCFLSSLLLSKVTIQSPHHYRQKEFRGLPAEALVDGGPCSFPLFDSRVGTVSHDCKCLSTQGTPGCMPERLTVGTVSHDCRCLGTRYTRLYAGEIGAYDLFTLVFFLRTKTGFEQKIVYNPVFWMLQSNVPSCFISTPIILGLCKPFWQSWDEERFCAPMYHSYCVTSQPGALGESIVQTYFL